MTAASPEEQGPVVRDKRRIDPETGALREPAEPAPAAPVDGGAEVTEEAAVDGELPVDEATQELASELAERTADLQRLSAEYANYRRRVDRDREAVKDQALASVLTALLPVLDDLDRAEQHGELVGGFQKVAESLQATVAKLGLVRFGEAGEPFDPTVHEALMHSYEEGVTEPTAVQVLQPGYRIGERVVRPARVAVAEPQQ